MQEESACTAPGAPMAGGTGANRRAQNAQKPESLVRAPRSAHPRTRLMSRHPVEALPGVPVLDDHRALLAAIAGLLVEARRRGLKARRLALCNSGDVPAGSRERVVG